jgi:hypothetical protein
MAQPAQCLLSKYEALSSNPSFTKKTQKPVVLEIIHTALLTFFNDRRMGLEVWLKDRMPT